MNPYRAFNKLKRAVTEVELAANGLNARMSRGKAGHFMDGVRWAVEQIRKHGGLNELEEDVDEQGDTSA